MNKVLINKQFIDSIKKDSNNFLSFTQKQDNGTIIYLLNRIGRLDHNFDRKPLSLLLKSPNETVRALAVKNLAKLSDISLLPTFFYIAQKDSSTIVRRESVSAIGRLRNQKAISCLVKFLTDLDPKIVMQAIRGLLVFKDDLRIKKELQKLLNHPNEVIKEVVNKELNGSQYTNEDKQNHAESPNFLRNAVVHADVIEVLKYVPNDSVHLTFTSPPYYNARDYSIYQSYAQYLNFLEIVFKEIHRVTKEGRFFVLNTSPIIVPRISRAHSSKRYPIPYDIHALLVKMNWEFIDDIVWIKPEASVKNRNAGFLQHRKPLAYKPNAITEMLMVYRKKTDKLIDWNMRQYSWDKVKKSRIEGNYETTNVWHVDPVFDKVHSAVFPIELCNRVIKFYSFVGDLIFDPFAGKGTLGKAASGLNRYFFLTEKEKKYIDRIKEELYGACNLSILENSKSNFYDLKTFILNSKHDINRSSN